MGETVIDERIAGWERLCEVATPGPWFARDELIWAGAGGEAVANVADWGHAAAQRDDADFIAAAREGWPATIAALRDAHAENERQEFARVEAQERADIAEGEFDTARAETAELRARIEAAHPIHVEKSGARVCATCLLVEPCPTRAALSPAGTEGAE